MRAFSILVSALLISASPAQATFTPYTNKADWQAASGAFSTITFTELPVGTNILDNYASLGVHFTDGIDLIYHNDVFVTDDYGVNGAFDSTTLQFDSGIYSIALDFPGGAQFKLYNDDQLVFTSPFFGGGGAGFFGGIVSDMPFNKVVMWDPLSGFVADNLYFGPPVPAPGAMCVFVVGLGVIRRRRRR